ncbi:MAG: hypothetical protein IH991_21880, partial [Planctomycetes bacterium]|nr:hypothetical protein [Planctomycetota bacterium]
MALDDARDDVSINGSGTLSEKSGDQELLGFAVSLGYDWSKKGLPFRSELEYTYRPRFDFDTRVRAGTDSDFENNVSSHMVTANVFYDIKTQTRSTPYIGVGIG